MHKCDVCGKSFKTLQALRSHTTYKHKKVTSLREITATTPLQIEQDPEILELRKKLEIKKLKRALEDLEETPTLMNLVERVTKLEEDKKEIDDLKNYEAKQDKILQKLIDLTSKLRFFNEAHIRLILVLIIRHMKDRKQLIRTLEEEYGLDAVEKALKGQPVL